MKIMCNLSLKIQLVKELKYRHGRILHNQS